MNFREYLVQYPVVVADKQVKHFRITCGDRMALVARIYDAANDQECNLPAGAILLADGRAIEADGRDIEADKDLEAIVTNRPYCLRDDPEEPPISLEANVRDYETGDDEVQVRHCTSLFLTLALLTRIWQMTVSPEAGDMVNVSHFFGYMLVESSDGDAFTFFGRDPTEMLEALYEGITLGDEEDTERILVRDEIELPGFIIVDKRMLAVTL